MPYVAFAYSTPFGPYSVTQLPHYGAGTNVTASLSGLEFSVSYTYKFDTGDNSWIPTHF